MACNGLVNHFVIDPTLEINKITIAPTAKVKVILLSAVSDDLVEYIRQCLWVSISILGLTRELLLVQ